MGVRNLIDEWVIGSGSESEEVRARMFKIADRLRGRAGEWASDHITYFAEVGEFDFDCCIRHEARISRIHLAKCRHRHNREYLFGANERDSWFLRESGWRRRGARWIRTLSF